MATRWLHPVLSPAELQADSIMNVPTLSDWLRIGRAVRGEWPLPWPPITQAKAGFDWVGRWKSEELVVMDTEYHMPSKFIYQVGLYGLESKECIIWDRGAAGHMPPHEVGMMLRSVLERCRVVTQNAQAEMLSLHATWGIDIKQWRRYEDTMLMHHALWSEMRHGLGFLASLHSEHDKVKHLGPGSHEYLRGDVVDTASVFEALLLELDGDEGARSYYEDRLLPLVPILCECKLRGIPLNQDKIVAYSDKYGTDAAEALLRARAYCGWPINMDSGDQLALQLTVLEDVYALVKGSGIRKKKTDSGKVSLSKDKMAELIEELDARGVEHPLLLARKAYIEARQLNSLVFKPLLGKQVVYPDIAIHAQATGRWSITDPPLSLIPANYRDIVSVPPGYRLVHGDWSAIEGRILTAWIRDEVGQQVYDNGWDIHTITACGLFNMDLPADPTNPHDDEEWCASWSPPWEGKDDIRRKFGKAFRYSLTYGKKAENISTIPGAKKLGLNDAELLAAARNWLKRNPKLVKYWDQISDQATRIGIVRDIYGKPRRLLNTNIDERIREAKNAPLQCSVASILNETVIMAVAELGDRGHFMFSSHDSTYWAIKEEYLEQSMELLRRIHERPIRICDDVLLSIPFDIELHY